MKYPEARVLLVEDNDMNRMMIEISMSEFEFVIESAVNGEIALNMFKDNPEGYYDMVFMDIMMPVMDGIEATKAIRDLERFDAMMVPIVALTAESDPEEIAKFPDYGFTEYLEKPMNMEKLSEVLEKYLG